MAFIADILYEAKKKLSAFDTAELDAELLLAYLLQKPRSFIIAYPDFYLTDEQLAQYHALIEARARKMPLAYLLGEKEFWSLTFQVTPDVLIPRPETELLLELLLKDAQQQNNLTVIDLGTGSGALAIALAHEKPNWQIIASDYSLAALTIAQQNAARLLKNSAHISFVHSDWLNDISKNSQADVIICNPPYLAEDDTHLLDSEISYEPICALVASNQGLAAYQKIAIQAYAHLTKGGRLYLEHGAEQAQAVTDIVVQAGFTQIKNYSDLAGLPRVISAVV